MNSMFTKAGILHRVGIACKNTNTPIEKGQVQELESKIRDLQNVIGVIVSVNGFQQGAEAYAEDKGIIALHLKDLPNHEFTKTVMIHL
ncbi:restriction endonuclease [Chitinophaga sancti]|uniref:Restriction endonuclease n=1 Tax=Chitinophaga sancti TaxID=1004 RepID=A0A1K1SDA2_9BACT|nr:restriction endonuclease [Chitinophaga sancti]WQD59929.1 restriction endonuclease [Chitinophaga sancti]WQG87941.1 restriction endonuclease [Chitinophaga sancti]SFW82353.1 Restriction endonuclease [Chitinophaga sancti]